MSARVQAQDDHNAQHRRSLRLRLPSNAALAPNIGCCNALLGAYVRAEIPQWQKVRGPQPIRASLQAYHQNVTGNMATA